MIDLIEQVIHGRRCREKIMKRMILERFNRKQKAERKKHKMQCFEFISS